MNAIRQIVENNNGTIILTLPDYIQTKKVEVIILPFEEEEKKSVKKNMSKYRGCLNYNLSIEEIDKQLKKLRSQWERDI